MKGKRSKLFVSHVHWPYLTDAVILDVLADNKNRFCLVLQFSSYVSTWVVVVLVQMQDGVDMKVIHTCPSHKDSHYIRSLFAVVNVIHEISKAINDNQTDTFVLS